MNNIIQIGIDVLRKVSLPVDIQGIKTVGLSRLIKHMRAILESSPDGVALAAPQIGKNIRLFVVSPRAYGDKPLNKEHSVFINPVITKRSKEKHNFEEGCLSVKDVYGQITRASKITVTALDEHGTKFTRGGSGLLAEIFQHEIDHLDGILFVDTATKLRKITPNDAK